MMTFVSQIPARSVTSFDEAWYLDAYPDVAVGVAKGVIQSGHSHWVVSGRAEGRIAPPGYVDAGPFDEDAYLIANPDVADAVRRGVYDSGRQHYLESGSAEGRSLGAPGAQAEPARQAADFDEAWYLEANPDIAAAVANGTLESGYAHWMANGRVEGRIAPPGYDEGLTFDAAFYLRSYPLVAEELAAQRAVNPHHHYETVGRFRGYLPNGFADRPKNPAGMVSQFGGLWPDQANAADLIAGRLDVGHITPEQADLLQHWVRYGYVILPHRLDADLVDEAARELQRAYDGQIDGLRFECPTLGSYHPIPWDPAVRRNPAKALDLHWLSPVIRDLIFARPLREFIELLFERRAMASQSLTFLRGSAQGYHRDTLYVPYSLPTQFVASWVALEDVSPGGGELTYFPGSHKLAERLYGGQYKTLWDAQRMLRRSDIRDEMKDYSERLAAQSREAGLCAQNFLAKKGDVLVWHADLAHGGLPIASDKTRASVVTHYCPREIAPLSFEHGGADMRDHQGVASYVSGVYRDF